jgi:hypothetical protein
MLGWGDEKRIEVVVDGVVAGIHEVRASGMSRVFDMSTVMERVLGREGRAARVEYVCASEGWTFTVLVCKAVLPVGYERLERDANPYADRVHIAGDGAACATRLVHPGWASGPYGAEGIPSLTVLSADKGETKLRYCAPEAGLPVPRIRVWNYFDVDNGFELEVDVAAGEDGDTYLIDLGDQCREVMESGGPVYVKIETEYAGRGDCDSVFSFYIARPVIVL